MESNSSEISAYEALVQSNLSQEKKEELDKWYKRNKNFWTQAIYTIPPVMIVSGAIIFGGISPRYRYNPNPLGDAVNRLSRQVHALKLNEHELEHILNRDMEFVEDTERSQLLADRVQTDGVYGRLKSNQELQENLSSRIRTIEDSPEYQSQLNRIQERMRNSDFLFFGGLLDLVLGIGVGYTQFTRGIRSFYRRLDNKLNRKLKKALEDKKTV